MGFIQKFGVGLNFIIRIIIINKYQFTYIEHLCGLGTVKHFTCLNI